jgi:hypothetical protein
MSQINMIPVDRSVVIDGYAAFGVDFTGIDPEIHAIAWYGSQGEVEYVWDPVANIKKPNETIYTLAPYQPYVSQAQAVIEAYTNPDFYYVTVADLVLGEDTFTLGQQIVIDTVDTPQPTGTTTIVPPTPEDFQQLYWFNDNWVISPVNPSFSLAKAKSTMIGYTRTSVAVNVNNQSRTYSDLNLLSAQDPAALMCADYSSVTLGDYQASQDGQAQSVIDQINSVSSVPQLYTLNPYIDPALV